MHLRNREADGEGDRLSTGNVRVHVFPKCAQVIGGQ